LEHHNVGGFVAAINGSIGKTEGLWVKWLQGRYIKRNGVSW